MKYIESFQCECGELFLFTGHPMTRKVTVEKDLWNISVSLHKLECMNSRVKRLIDGYKTKAN